MKRPKVRMLRYEVRRIGSDGLYTHVSTHRKLRAARASRAAARTRCQDEIKHRGYKQSCEFVVWDADRAKRVKV